MSPQWYWGIIRKNNFKLEFWICISKSLSQFDKSLTKPKQLVTRKNYFQEEILFLRKQLNEAYQTLTNNGCNCKRRKTNLPEQNTKQDHRTEWETNKYRNILILGNKSNQKANPKNESISWKLPENVHKTDGGRKEKKNAKSKNYQQ